MKAINKYFPVVVFTLLLHTVHVFACKCNVKFEQRNMAAKGYCLANHSSEENLSNQLYLREHNMVEADPYHQL